MMDSNKETEHYRLKVNGLKGNLQRSMYCNYDLKAQLRILMKKYNLLQAKYNLLIKGRKESFKGNYTKIRTQHKKGDIKDFQSVNKVHY